MARTVIVILIIALLFLVMISMYNGFIRRRNAMRNAFASIDVQLKKRWDLIPNLVETVKGFAKQERELFENVIEARLAAQKFPTQSRQRAEQENKISAGVSRLLAVAEDYPDLKSGEHFLNLQRNLTEVESQISASRRAYNAAVQSWNNGVESFPGSVFANVFHFEKADWFEIKDQQRQGVEVNFSRS